MAKKAARKTAARKRTIRKASKKKTGKKKVAKKTHKKKGGGGGGGRGGRGANSWTRSAPPKAGDKGTASPMDFDLDIGLPGDDAALPSDETGGDDTTITR